MGMYHIICPVCTDKHYWFSGSSDQRCFKCLAAEPPKMMPQPNTVTIAATTVGDQERYTAKRDALIEYLRMKTDESDWHAVSDAANDLRVLEAQRP